MKYKAHIISHSHWDREWYIPYEQHHMRLVDLIDDIIELCEKDDKFNSFHLDGQTIPLEDYLEVKPENRERLQKIIDAGKLKIGPWYILQDAFLTSSEANVRNMQIGHKLSKKWGKKSKVGYYPDTFGIYGQAAQLMKKSEIENLYFGRGVSPTGFNNEVSDNFESKFSEMIVEAPNGDRVTGILFANWYSNGNEIPVERDKAIEFWDKKLADAKKYSSSKHLLFMNGCDHQPLQKDITKAIDLANNLYDDVEFVHSSLDEYYSELQKDIEGKELNIIKGELRSQNTNGRYTLVNTASSRIYQKQKNFEIQNSLEKLAEPLATFAFPKELYPKEKLDYAWKLLMQNHPHDSICGCSVDSVHRTMDARFESSKEVAKFIISESLERLGRQIKSPKGEGFTIFNTLDSSEEKVHVVEYSYKKFKFGDYGLEVSRKKAEDLDIKNLAIFDTKGRAVEARIEDMGAQFAYDLPKDGFRVPYYTRKLKIELLEKLAPLSWESYYIKETKEEEKIENSIYFMENSKLKIQIKPNGSLEVTDKERMFTYENILTIFDEGDVGNEYMFGKVKNDKAIFTKNDITLVKAYKNSVKQEIIYQVSMDIPVSATEETLKEEKRKLVEYYKRDSKRSNLFVNTIFNITINLVGENNYFDCKIEFENKSKDHRLRALFPTDLENDFVKVDSIFETAKRPTLPSKYWENENNDGHMSKFVSLSKGGNSMTVATRGLNEYEIMNKKDIAITLLRGISEMGDWGHFDTEESQCLGKHNLELRIFFHKEESEYKYFKIAKNSFIDLPYVSFFENEDGKTGFLGKFFDKDIPHELQITAIKRNEMGELVIRINNISKNDIEFPLENAYETNLLEEKKIRPYEGLVKSNEIMTLILE